MTEEISESHTLISPAKVDGKWRLAGTVVTVGATVADHLRTAGAIGKDASAASISEDIGTLRQKISLLEVELAEVYDARAEESSTAAARILELEGERDAANRAVEEANARASAISAQANVDHQAAVARIAELEQLVGANPPQMSSSATGSASAEQKLKPEKSKK